MTTPALLYAVGAALEAWLAAMLFVSSRALFLSAGRRSVLLATAFACNSLRSALLAMGIGDVAPSSPASLPVVTLLTVVLCLFNAGLLDYVGLKGAIARRLNMFVIAVLALLYAANLAGWVTRGQDGFVVALFFFGWVALFARAAAAEPRSGHAWIILALLTNPVCAVGLSLGWLPLDLLAMREVVPIGAVGITVLTTGLIRSHRRAQREADLTARALQAREQAQADLRALNATLEQRVARRTQELEDTIEGLESFNRSVSHDLRGPLGGIAGVAQLAREAVGAGHAEQADRMLAAIAKQADDSVAMVAALLALARAGNAQPQRAHVDTTKLVEEVVGSLAECATTGPEIVVHALPEADADRELLRQVFANLIGNACKFAGAKTAGRIEVGHAATPQGEAYFVRDNGVGFSNADAQRLFKPFQRLHGTRHEGFGVGLSIVRRIVDHHGGRVWADGMPGRGATFWFTLGAG